MIAGELTIPRQEPEGTPTQSRLTRFRETLRQQFRSVMERLTRPAEPQPKPRRRKREEAGGGFTVAATILLRRIERIPLFRSLNPTWDTFTWLHLWEYNEAADASFHQDCSAAASSPPSELSPRL